ncbi:DMT family transporter [Alkalihalophilus lindianensis]|uniref:DMT family transporter n=1 Tax=Alkalihalophilus lindianensis TaxID=1630542 RepID=A0ABU3XBC9_9BACI|nr:DMT family transporter [Alkalihalophilus lindianensis]MDV2685197.1 DMT family transporter [Alkalihalophilus lindianensis]
MKANYLYILFLFQCLIGGTTWAFQKVGLEGSLPLWSAGMRFVIAGSVILVILLLLKKVTVKKELLIVSFLYGMMYFTIPFGVIYWSSLHLPTGLISVLAASISVFALIVSSMVIRSIPSPSQILGTIAAFLGIAIVFSNQMYVEVTTFEVISMFLILLAMLGSAIITVSVKKKLNHFPIINFTCFAMLSGGALLTISSLLFETGSRSFGGISLISLLYLAVVGSMIGFAINMYLLKKWHISKATAHLYISPIIALYIGSLFLNEQLNIGVYVGSIFVIAGVMLINLNLKFKKKSLLIKSETPMNR